MPINLSTNGIGKIMLGSSTEIVRVYLGTTIVYESQKPHIFVFEVDAGDQIVLQNDTRGLYPAATNWGDGTIDNNLSHTYTTAGRYNVTTVYSLATSYGTGAIPNSLIDPEIVDLDSNSIEAMRTVEALQPTYHRNTVRSLVAVTQISPNINNINYMFYDCVYLRISDINISGLDLSKFNEAVAVFYGCTSYL